MTSSQFECLAKLLRSRSLSREACRRVLVMDQRQCDVARDLDVSPVLVAVSLKRYRTAQRAIEEAWMCGAFATS